jgi:hypothetical protein
MISQNEAYLEQAIPSKYHTTWKVATQIDPTSLRAIVHLNQNTQQSRRLCFSYSVFKQEEAGKE